jgi:hypothetical protein
METQVAVMQTLREFLADNKFSRAEWYRIPAEDRPRVVRIGRKILISAESAAEWRARMERK